MTVKVYEKIDFSDNVLWLPSFLAVSNMGRKLKIIEDAYTLAGVLNLSSDCFSRMHNGCNSIPFRVLHPPVKSLESRVRDELKMFTEKQGYRWNMIAMDDQVISVFESAKMYTGEAYLVSWVPKKSGEFIYHYLLLDTGGILPWYNEGKILKCIEKSKIFSCLPHMGDANPRGAGAITVSFSIGNLSISGRVLDDTNIFYSLKGFRNSAQEIACY